MTRWMTQVATAQMLLILNLIILTGQYLCDSQCPMFKMYNIICSHTLAAAEDSGKRQSRFFTMVQYEIPLS